MGNDNIHGCPAPQNITLIQRMQPLVGRTVTVFTPNFPRLAKTTGKLSNITSTSFFVGSKQIVFATSFFIVLRNVVRVVKPFRVTATAEDMGSVTGQLIRVGRDFVEFVQVPGKRDVPTLFPLNLFTEVTCEREHEE